MGSYDGAEVCQLVGAYLLNNLSHIIDKTAVGLYRDNELGVLKVILVLKLKKNEKKL